MSSPSARRSRSAPTRSTVALRSSTVTARPRPWPTMPATLCVPLRRSRSCPPPTMARRERRRRWRTTSAPTPFGPPNLWALIDDEIGARARAPRRRATGTPARRRCAARPAAHASARRRRRRRAAGRCRSRCWRASPTRRRRRSSSVAASRRDRRRRARRRPRPRRRRARRSRARRGARRRDATIDAARGRRRRPSTAVLSASVPPPVKTISPGSQPSAVGHHVARVVDGTAARRAPWACAPDGLPNALREERHHRLDRLGRIGVVAAWSKYA